MLATNSAGWYRCYMTDVLGLLFGPARPGNIGGLAALALAFLSGCPSDERPDRSGRLVLALSSDPGHLNPAITTSGGVQTASKLLYNGLVELGAAGEPLPELAERWEIEDDGALYRFYLRRDVLWHDGEPFTSADVKFSFEEILTRYHSRTRSSLATVLRSVDTPDPHIVEFRFSHPYAPLLQQLNVLETPILPRHIYEGTDPLQNPANRAPVGTGPFQFEAYRPGTEIRFVANPNYFKPGLPLLDDIVMRVIPEKGNQVIGLETGEIDWLFGIGGLDRRRLEKNDDIAFLQNGNSPGGSNCIMTLSFNLERPILRDVRVRRGIAHAIDRDQFLERVLFGEGQVARAPISSGIAFAHATGLGLPDFDPAESDRLLSEVGWVRTSEETRMARGIDGIEDGTPLEIEFLHFPTFAAYGQLLRAQLRSIGIDIRLRTLEPSVFVEAVFSDGDFDTNIISYCNSTDPEIGVRRMYVSSNIAPIPFSNAARYRNAEVDRLFDEARATVDKASRTALYRRIQEILVEELPYFWIVETVSTRAYRTRCNGFKLYGHFADSVSCN